jgi:hypothetical protein
MQIRILGALDPSLFFSNLSSAGKLPLILNSSGRVPVRRITRENPGTLVLTSSDLEVPGCKSVFGFADRRRCGEPFKPGNRFCEKCGPPASCEIIVGYAGHARFWTPGFQCG